MQKRIQLEVEFVEWDRFKETADLALGVGRQQMGQMQEAGFPFLGDTEHADQIQTQHCEVGDVFLAERLFVQMCPDESESSQGVCADSEFRHRFDGGGAPRPDQYLFDDSPARDKQSDGTAHVA